jgi:hypothetical protein
MGLFDPILDRVLGPKLAPEEVPSAVEIPPEVTLRRGGLVLAVGSMFMGRDRNGNRRRADAMTLGNTILVRAGHRPSAKLLHHELVHVRQWRDPLFPLKYAVQSLRHGYRDNPYEVEAFEEADRAFPPPPRPERQRTP